MVWLTESCDKAFNHLIFYKKRKIKKVKAEDAMIWLLEVCVLKTYTFIFLHQIGFHQLFEIYSQIY